MRRLFLGCLIALSLAASARAASLDPSRIAAIGQAAEAFLARAAEVRKTGMVPRQSDPAIAPLLDTVFDTTDLSHGPIDYADVEKLSAWLGRLNAVGGVYLAAARAARDTGLFGAEIGRYYDAALGVMQAMAECQMANLDAHPGATLSPTDRRKLDQLRDTLAGALGTMIEVFRAPGITVEWARDRLAALSAAAPTMARFLTPDQLARLRAMAFKFAQATRDKSLRAAFAQLAAALAEPRAPIAAPADVPAGGAEIALESDGQGYRVPGRINGALTVKFFIDSGASVVVLPKDLVETLTKSGAIAASDLLGRDIYVTADGKRHHGTRLMLRQLDVGGHTVTNVLASVAPAHTEPLLGQTFLAKFKSWTLDNRRHVLIIAE